MWSSENVTTPLRVLIANERTHRRELLAEVVARLGHEVIAQEVDIEAVAAVTVREPPDVAMVGVGSSPQHALGLIKQIVHESGCPVIALLSAEEPDYVREAARRGIFAYVVDTAPEGLQSAIDIALERFKEYQDLQGAFGRRTVIEQAKGILMACHAIDADEAFGMLRNHSQGHGRKVTDVATAIIESHLLLRAPRPPPPPSA
jgi:two-component system, response regulator / RNA-binding antiterminator